MTRPRDSNALCGASADLPLGVHRRELSLPTRGELGDDCHLLRGEVNPAVGQDEASALHGDPLHSAEWRVLDDDVHGTSPLLDLHPEQAVGGVYGKMKLFVANDDVGDVRLDEKRCGGRNVRGSADHEYSFVGVGTSRTG